MDYLQTTVRYLQEQNRELKDKLKRMSDLNSLITRQRQTQERDYLHKFHQEEIAVIRQIATQHQKSLKAEIKKLNQEITELNEAVEKQLDTTVALRKEITQLEIKNSEFGVQVNELKIQLKEAEEKQQQIFEQFQANYAKLQEEYCSREKEVIQKYMEKLQQRSDRHDEELRKQAKFADFLQNKLNAAEKEKQLLSEEVSALIATLTHHQQKGNTKVKAAAEEALQLKKENNNLKVYIKNLQMEVADLEAQKSAEQNKVGKTEKQCTEMRARVREVQRSKNRQIQREKSKNKSIISDLSHQKQRLKEQAERQRRKEADFNNSKKLLISKIKEIQNKYEKQKGRSTFDKTSAKTVKKSLDTFQSVSLDNSFQKQKESPSISCFLKDDRVQPSCLASHRQLKIDTSNSHIQLLRLKDLDTPCFESSKAQHIKKTIKIRK